jgi:predicted Rossmann fold flavoprotein
LPPDDASRRRGDCVHPLVVVGAGAAGLFAATFAARDGARVLLLETSERPGAKIRVSGGGRCNLLPRVARLEDFWTTGSRLALRNILFAWPLEEVRAHFERRLGLALVDEPSGKVFPRSGSAREVSDALLADCRRAGVELRAGARVLALRAATADPARFAVELGTGEVLAARRVVLATGGLSLPKTGSDGAGYRFAQALGHSLRSPRPALVPLLTANPIWHELAGVALPVTARVLREGVVLEERGGDLLFTHRGFSGPVVLDLSRHFTDPHPPPARLRVAWGGLARREWDAILREGGGRLVATALRTRLPDRLADRLAARAELAPGTRASGLRREARRRLALELADCDLDVSGDEGFRAAVTGGGVPLEEVHPRTLESRLRAGLHFAGEMLDATGRLGGFNFLWAWVTGRTAGRSAAALLADGA